MIAAEQYKALKDRKLLAIQALALSPEPNTTSVHVPIFPRFLDFADPLDRFGYKRIHNFMSFPLPK